MPRRHARMSPVFVRLHEGDEILDVIGGKTFRGHQRHGRLGDDPDRLEILDRIVAQVAGELRIAGMRRMHDEERVAIPRSSRPDGADGAAGAAATPCRPRASLSKDLLPGFVWVDQGGVVRLAELQSLGKA